MSAKLNLTSTDWSFLRQRRHYLPWMREALEMDLNLHCLKLFLNCDTYELESLKISCLEIRALTLRQKCTACQNKGVKGRQEEQRRRFQWSKRRAVEWFLARRECRLVLFYLFSEDGEANSFHSSKDLDNWSFVLRLTPDESWLLTQGEAWQIVY